MKLNFVVRESKVGKNATAPLELSVIIDGERRCITLDRRCNPSKWDTKNQKAKGSKELNEYIDTIRSRCYALESEMLSLKLHLTVDTFVNAFRNGIKLNTITIEQAFSDTIIRARNCVRYYT